MKNQRQKIVLLDVHAILHRAYHALPDFATSKGIPTGALYGLVTMLLKILSDIRPDYVVACYDLPKPTYRHEVYKDYKAGRAKTDGDLVEQIKRSGDIFNALNIPMYSKEGFEADDMLGTIVEQLTHNDMYDVVIASGDMDTLQLVSGTRVQVYTLKKGIKDTILYNEQAVLDRFGFGPKLLPDYKGLRGDPSDNIIGIAGIGEKTAALIIKKFGTIDDIYKTLHAHPEKMKAAGVSLRIQKLLSEGEEEARFSKMLATIRKDAPIDFVVPTQTFSEGVDFEKVDELCSLYEFRTLPSKIREVVTGRKEEKEEECVYDEKSLLFKEAAVMVWLLDSNITKPKAQEICDYMKVKTLEDAHRELEKKLQKENLFELYITIEKPLISILDDMHEVGVAVDAGYLKRLGEEYHTKLKELEEKIHSLAGVTFNIASPKQLGEVLFDKLLLAPKNHKKTSTGAKSTKESELEKLKDVHPIISLILEHRELAKLLGTYIDAIPPLLDEKNRLHTTFIQTGTTTGRMASHNPNLQNIPMRSPLGKSIRKAFIPEKGYVLVSFDYSQIELRIAAFLSQDKKMLDIFKRGVDVHRAVAAQVFSVEESAVTSEMRSHAKVINFGILYGMGVTALQQNLGTTRTEAQKFYNDYFNTFTELGTYLDTVKQNAVRDGYTETLFGRRRYFEGLKSKIPYVRAMAERMAMNAPIQGTEADIIKYAMVRIGEWIKKENCGNDVRMLLQVHDELVFEIVPEKLDMYAHKIQSLMQEVPIPGDTERVVAVVEGEVGPNWLEGEKMC